MAQHPGDPDPRLHTVAKPVAAVRRTCAPAGRRHARRPCTPPKAWAWPPRRSTCNERVVVIDTSEERNDPRVLINPEIVWASDEMIVWEEAACRFPHLRQGRPSRPVKRGALNRDGQRHEFEADGLLAVLRAARAGSPAGQGVCQYLSPLKRNRIKTKLAKRDREAAHEAGFRLGPQSSPRWRCRR